MEGVSGPWVCLNLVCMVEGVIDGRSNWPMSMLAPGMNDGRSN